MDTARREWLSEGQPTQTDAGPRFRGPGHRAVSRVVTLLLAVGFAVVGVAGAANAWNNVISGTVTCATGGGWAVTWQVDNRLPSPETITASNRPSAVPVGTMLAASETRMFTETVTTKPTAALTLTLSAEWDTGESSNRSGTIDLAAFDDDCIITTVTPPTVPVIDDCGPGNARFGPVPTGAWTSKTNPDGSLTITANPGYIFPNGQQSVTYPKPVDSNQPCPTPPVVTPPQVLPAEVRGVQANVRSIDKCGTRSDMFRVANRAGVVYTAKGKTLREGVWLKARTRSMTVRAAAANATYRIEGKKLWRMTFTDKPCAKAPEIAPNTGL